MSDLAIIGGGASAVCMLDALAQSGTEPGTITLFEPAPSLWRGRPFQQDTAAVRVNAPPEEMSVRFGDSSHFERWLTARDLLVDERDGRDPYCGSRFVPRAVFGEYLEQCASAALMTLLERDWQVRLVRDAVTAGTPAGDGLELTAASGERFHVDQVVLCVGGSPPADPYGLTGAPGFIGEPFPLAATLRDVDADADVAVIGSGLTGIDVVTALAEREHRGRIRLLSRRGVLPGVRQRPVAYALRHFTPEWFRDAAARGEVLTLPQVVDRMRAEFTEAGETFDPVAAELAALAGGDDPLNRLRRNLAEVDAPGLALRILQRAVPETGPDLWPLLSADDKTEVLHTHYRALMSLCCPMPPSSAARLLDLVETGRLGLGSGLEKIERLSDGQFGITTAGRDSTADVVISAVNAPAHKIPPKARPLITSFETAGLAQRHPRGGVHIERATSRMTVGGVPDPRVYALGDLAAGSLFFTFGIPSLVDRAYDIAACLGHSSRTPSSGRADAALQTV